MNRIRKQWKNNGTPFFFIFKNNGYSVYIDSSTCLDYDNVVFDRVKGFTCLDALVDVTHVYRSLLSVDDSFVKTYVLFILQKIIQHIQIIYSLNKKV